MALEWADVNLTKRQVSVARSDWKGHVTATKGGRVVRHLPLSSWTVSRIRDRHGATCEINKSDSPEGPLRSIAFGFRLRKPRTGARGARRRAHRDWYCAAARGHSIVGLNAGTHLEVKSSNANNTGR
jgi:hypothetical protein